MKIIGKWCSRVDTLEGRESFKSMYDMDIYEFIFEQEVFNISRLFAPEYEYIVFLEYDGTPNQVFYLEAGEHLMVYNTIPGEIFNTDSMAFFSLIRDCERIGTFHTNHSPYSFSVSDNQLVKNEFDLTSQQVLDNINNYCAGKELQTLANMNNTLLVREL